MHNATQTAEAIVDLWAYADIVIEQWRNIVPNWDWTVSWIYENESHQHIGIPLPENNTYLLIVVDKMQRQILGHYILNLNQLYGLI